MALPTQRTKGCGLEPLIVDAAIDAALALPSSDCHNAAILEGEMRVATEGAVLASE